MVISHKYKYIFIEFPLTGSTSISRALVDEYSGEKILFKHATYIDFLKNATEQEKKYFVFTCIRNPLDVVVSHYFKYRTDHRGRYSRLKKNRGINKIIYKYQLKRFNYASQSTFNDYFLKYYKLPYNSWSTISHPYCDFVIRFENLSGDYFEALRRIGIHNPLPLLKANTTNKNKADFISCYSTKSIVRAKKVFGIYMGLLEYEFPKEWGEVNIAIKEKILFKLQNIYKHLYWKYLRYYALKLGKISKHNKK